jgi:hypothetical protein
MTTEEIQEGNEDEIKKIANHLLNGLSLVRVPETLQPPFSESEDISGFLFSVFFVIALGNFCLSHLSVLHQRVYNFLSKIQVEIIQNSSQCFFLH